MHDNKFVISISGNGECGKDTAALYLSHFLKIPYQQSTSSCVVQPWWEEIQDNRWSKDHGGKPKGLEHINIEVGDYKSKEEFYADRRNRRMDWVDYIEAFNWSYGGHGVGLYAKAVEDGNQILTGIRRKGQFQRCLAHIIDVAIWIDRDGTVDESQEYDSSMCHYVIENNGTFDDLKTACADLSSVILRDMKHASYTVQWIEKVMLDINMATPTSLGHDAT